MYFKNANCNLKVYRTMYFILCTSHVYRALTAHHVSGRGTRHRAGMLIPALWTL